MKNFKSLIIWQKGIAIVKCVYLLTESFPSQEKYGIVAQMTRAAISISANIAEGSSRNSDKDNARFLQLALGSAFELQTYLVITREMQWAASKEIDNIEEILVEEIKMIHSFIKKLTAKN